MPANITAYFNLDTVRCLHDADFLQLQSCKILPHSHCLLWLNTLAAAFYKAVSMSIIAAHAYLLQGLPEALGLPELQPNVPDAVSQDSALSDLTQSTSGAHPACFSPV